MWSPSSASRALTGAWLLGCNRLMTPSCAFPRSPSVKIRAGMELTREQDPGKTEELKRGWEVVAGAYNVLPMDAAAFRAWKR